MRAGFPRDENKKREQKVSQDGAPRHTQSLGLYKEDMPAEAEKEGTEREEKTQGSGWKEGKRRVSGKWEESMEDTLRGWTG